MSRAGSTFAITNNTSCAPIRHQNLIIDRDQTRRFLSTDVRAPLKDIEGPTQCFLATARSPWCQQRVVNAVERENVELKLFWRRVTTVVMTLPYACPGARHAARVLTDRGEWLAWSITTLDVDPPFVHSDAPAPDT